MLEHRTRRPVLSPCPSHARPAPCPHRCARSGGVGAGCFLWLYETTARTALQVRGDAPSNESFVLDHRGFHRIREYLPQGTPLGDAVGVQAWCVGAVGREEPAKRCLPHTLPFDCRPRGGRVAHPSSQRLHGVLVHWSRVWVGSHVTTTMATMATPKLNIEK